MNKKDIKNIRIARGWSQAEMADALGVNQATVSRIENGEVITGPVLRLLQIFAAENEKRANRMAKRKAARDQAQGVAV